MGSRSYRWAGRRSRPLRRVTARAHSGVAAPPLPSYPVCLPPARRSYGLAQLSMGWRRGTRCCIAGRAGAFTLAARPASASSCRPATRPAALTAELCRAMGGTRVGSIEAMLLGAPSSVASPHGAVHCCHGSEATLPPTSRCANPTRYASMRCGGSADAQTSSTQLQRTAAMSKRNDSARIARRTNLLAGWSRAQPRALPRLATIRIYYVLRIRVDNS